MAVIDDTNEQQPSLIKDAIKEQAKKQVKKQAKKVGKKVAKGTVKATAKTVKATVKLIAKILGTFSSVFGGVITPIICFMLITVMIVTLFYNAFNVEQYKQECPELVRVFLEENYQQFEDKVNMYCHDEAFVSFVCDSEFDNGYTKLVYGGTNAYTKDELKGNYKGVQNQRANWVSYDEANDRYSAKSVLQTVQEYIDAGVDVSNIKINDEYLKGYGEASGYGNKTSLTFDKWINYSYYTIPFYYHWNMAKNSQYESPSVFLGYTYSGDSHGLPSWMEDDDNYWGFMDYANTEGKEYDGLPVLNTKVFTNTSSSQFNYTNMTYEDYLNTGWMSFKANKNNAGAIPSNSKLADDYEDGTGYFAKGIMLGYKMDKEEWILEKAVDKLLGKDQLYNYYPISKYFVARDGFYDKGESDIYLYDWFEEKSGKKTNYEKYIMKPTDIKTIGKREKSNGTSELNKNVEMWINNFAEYFAKEIYYIYPNRDYIVDYFLADDVEKDKKIAFLQRSFYAMASGSELDLVLDEEYTIKNGVVGSVLNETVCGSLNISDLSISDTELVGYFDSYTEVFDGNMLNTSTTDNPEDVQKRIDQVLEYLNTTLSGVTEEVLNDSVYEIHVLYNATVRVQYNDGQEDLYFKIPVSNILTYSVGTGQARENSVTFNGKGLQNIYSNKHISKAKSKKYLSSIVKFDWDEDYYNAQFEYEDDSTEKGTNPLEGLEDNIKFENYQDQTWDIDLLEISSDKMKTALVNYCNTEKNPLYNLFNGSMKGNRSINFQYSDHSFLNYDVNEKKDQNGNVTKVTIQIYTYYPDTSKYSEGEYRVAYGFENGEALNQAFNLLNYKLEHEGETGRLTDLNDKVDFSALIISSDGSYADTGAVYESTDLYTYIADIIYKVESSGNWGAIARPYNVTNSEKTITVGAYQFYGERGHKLLRKICKKKKDSSLSIVGQTLYDQIMSTTNWETTGFGSHGELSETDYENLTKLLKTDYGINCQKEEMANSIKVYIELAKGKDIEDIKCQAYFAVMYHQSPQQTYNVVADWQNKTEDGRTLDTLHAACLNNDVFGDYPARYKTTFEMCKQILSMSVSGDMAKVLQYAQSSKVIGKKYGRSDLYSSQKYKPTYDCSELTYCAFYYGAGLVLPPTAANQEAWCQTNATLICKGTQNLSIMQPGDLIFYAEKGSSTAKGNNGISHVALYIGDGKLVEAGDPVGIYDAASNWHVTNFYATYRIDLSK